MFVKFEGMHKRRIRRSDTIDWSNKSIVKAAFTFCNILVLTDDEKIKLRLKYFYKYYYNNC